MSGDLKTVLVTGGAGFIGGTLAERLVRSGRYRVVIADNLLTGSTGKLPSVFQGLWKFIKCDVNQFEDIAPLMTAFRFDYVFHYAAVVGVKRTLENPVLVLNDIQGIRNILSLSKNTGVQRVFYSSSSEVYGEPVTLPQNEHTTPLNSRLPYAVVKNVGEAFCRSYQAEYGLDYTIFRFFNTYGPKQSTDFVMSRFIRAALAGEDLTIYGDGNQTRTFCYIDDNVDATVATMERGAFVNDVVNIGNDRVISVLDLANTIRAATGSSSPIRHLPPLPEGDMSRRQPDITKMRALLQRDLTPLEEGICRVIREGPFGRRD
jgi:UDP-glucose 4-epimerase